MQCSKARLHGCSSAQTGIVPTLRGLSDEEGTFENVTAYKIMFMGGVFSVCALKPTLCLRPTSLFSCKISLVNSM